MSNVLRWLYKDTDDNIFYRRELPANAVRFKPSDFKSRGQEVFNYHFIPEKMTDLELEYLNGLVEEFKHVGTSNYRRHQIWRSLNWAPVAEQFSFVYPNSNPFYAALRKYAINFSIQPRTFEWTTELKTSREKINFLGFWAQPYYESLYGIKIDDRSSINIDTPDNRGKQLIPVPAFVLDRNESNWDGVFVGGSVTISKDKNIIQNPFKTDSNGNIISIGNLDGIIRAKRYGWKYKGKDIPDQEIVHYIRIKYGFSHAMPHSANPETGKPYAFYYIIPFWDNESTSSSNLGKISIGETIVSNLGNDGDPSQMIAKDVTVNKQISSISLKFPGTVYPWQWYFEDLKQTSNLIAKIISESRKNPIENGKNNYEMSWNQIFHFSTVRACWRASKILNELVQYSNYIDTGIKKGYIYPVAGKIKKNSYEIEPGVESAPEYTTGIFFISAKSVGKTHHKKSEKNDTHAKERYIQFEERPWNHIFKSSIGGKNSYASDRNIRRNGDCVTTTQYLRHIILPDYNFYVSDILYTDQQIRATKKSLDRRCIFYHPIIDEFVKSKNLYTKEIVDYLVGRKLDLPSLGESTTWLKKNKSLAFSTGISIVGVAEVAGHLFHDYHTFHNICHKLVFAVESALVASKVYTHIKAGDHIKAARDAVVFGSQLVLSKIAEKGLLRIAGTQITSFQIGMVGIVVSIGIFFLDRWKYSTKYKKKQDKFIEKINHATANNLLEGPYAQSGGYIEISKGPNGELPTKSTIDKDGKIINEYENFILKEKNIESENLKEKNIRFLKENGDGEKKFFSQLTKIECDTILEIAGTINPYTGKYNEILNLSPNHYDIGAFITSNRGLGFKIDGDFYFTFGNSDLYNLIPDKEKNIKLDVIGGPPANARGPKFRYTRESITRSTDLTPYLNGAIKSNEPVYRLYNNEIQTIPFRTSTVDVTDKEKIWLIRKKYGLDAVIPYGDCCSMFDIPADLTGVNFPSNQECIYVIDFTSPNFIEKVKKFCNQNQSRDNQQKNKNLSEIDDIPPATIHGFQQEISFKNSVIIDFNNARDNRRKNKRISTSKTNYDGSSITSQNLAQLPRLGIPPGISSNSIGTKNILSDVQTSQLFAIEQIDTEKINISRTVDMIIDIFGTLLSMSLSNRERSIASVPEAIIELGPQSGAPSGATQTGVRTWRRPKITPPSSGTIPGRG